jgi:membrane protease YdiL (CAAX protease family)
MNRIFWRRFLLILVIFVAVQGGTYLLLRVLGIEGRDYSPVLINTVFLAVCVGLIRLLSLSAEDIGLKLLKDRLPWHIAICLVIFASYMAFYLFAVRISSLRPISSKTAWGMLNYLVVAFAEEIYFRGICYSVVQKRYSGRAALLVSTLLFGLVHVRQGLGMIPKFFTGWLWGTVRYSSGMIYLLIIPIHFAYNVVWLLYEGNWENPPLWAQFFPLYELLLGIVIMGVHAWIARRTQVATQRVAKG